MELTAAETDLFAPFLAPFTALAGDKRTARLIGDTIHGIIASESLCCSRIAAFSPRTGGGQAQRKASAAHGAW